MQSLFLPRPQNKPPPSGSWREWACCRENGTGLRRLARECKVAVPSQLFPFCPVGPFPGRRLLSPCQPPIHLRACSIGRRQPAICPWERAIVQDLGRYQPVPSHVMACQRIEETRGGSEGGKHLRGNQEDPTAPKKHPGQIRQYMLPSAAALKVKVPFLSVTPNRGPESRPVLCPLRSSLPIFQRGTLVGTPGHRLQFCFRRQPRTSLSQSPSPNPL